MKAGVICSVIILITEIQASLGTNVQNNMAAKSDLLIRERRDEEPQYPDDIYDSDEQDRWPTLEELSNTKRLSTKRGRIMGSPVSLEEAKRAYMTRRQSLENNLYDLLSTRPRPAPERRTTDSLKDVYMADLPKRHRLPRSPEETTLQRGKAQPVSEQPAPSDHVGDLSE